MADAPLQTTVLSTSPAGLPEGIASRTGYPVSARFASVNTAGAQAPFAPGPARKLDEALDFQYGGIDRPKASAFLRGQQRRRMDLMSLALNVFLPWLLFCTVFALLSFSLHFSRPSQCYELVGLGLVAVLGVGYAALRTLRQKWRGQEAEPSWVVFLFFAMALAWGLGLVLGNLNYMLNMQQYYDLSNLNYYPAVDPAQKMGQELMDAGRVVFSPTAQLDLQRSMGFKNDEVYCVAPITVGDTPLNSYDFWAVGMNCCSAATADFQCGEYANAQAHAGLRLMRDDERQFFRLAVEQAEATYGIRAVHPLFFKWVQDPTAEMNTLEEAGYKYYVLGMFCYFAFNLFCAGMAATFFAKLGYVSA